MRRAVIYLRVSTKEQAEVGGEAEGYSIPAQREACFRKAESLDAEVVEEYVDRGESARSADRPALKEMLARMESERDVDFMIVHKVDRLARSRADDVTIGLQLQACGVTLVSCTESIDETPSGRLLHGIMASIAEFYSRNLGSEVSKGLTQKVKAGGTPGRAPIGYLNRRVVTADGREANTVVVDDERAPLITWAFDQYATGNWTQRRLLDELTERGLTTRATAKQPARALHLSMLWRMLSNPYYMGMVSFKGALHPGKHTPIVSQATFERVQEVLEANDHAGEKRRKHLHYLKGSVFCGKCGGRLAISHTKGRGGLYVYFFCLGRQRYKANCWQKALTVDHVEQAVERYWLAIRLEPARVAQIQDVLKRELSAERDDASTERVRQERRVGTLQAERHKLLQAHYAEAIPLDLLKSEQQRIGHELAAAEQRLAATTARYDEVERVLLRAVELAAELGDAYQVGSDEVRRLFNQAVFKKLYLTEDGVVGADLTETFAALLADDLVERIEAQLAAREAQGREAEQGRQTRPYERKRPGDFAGALTSVAEVRGWNAFDLVRSSRKGVTWGDAARLWC